MAYELPAIPDQLNLHAPALAGVKAVLALASANGGTGKSTLTANLAVALALKKRKVGVIDANFEDPALAMMLGIKRMLSGIGASLEPTSGPLGIRVLASDPDFDPHPLDLHEDTARAGVNGTDPGAAPLSLTCIATQARFGALDLLLIDLPQGIAPVIELASHIPQAQILWVVTNSRLSTNASRRALKIARLNGITSLGLLENLQGFYCGGCHSVRPLLPDADGAALSREFDLPSFGRLPFDSRLAECADTGRLFIREFPDTPLAKLLTDLATRLTAALTPATTSAAAPV